MTGSLPRVWVNGELVDPTAPSVAPLDHCGHGRRRRLRDGQDRPRDSPSRCPGTTAASSGPRPGLGLPAVDLASSKRHRRRPRRRADRLRPAALQRHRRHRAARLGPGHDAALTYIVVAAPQAGRPPSGKVTVVPWTRNERSARRRAQDDVVCRERRRPRPRQGAGAMEAVFGNTRGELCECTGSNIFVVVDGVVLTPPDDSGLLAGITRELVHRVGSGGGRSRSARWPCRSRCWTPRTRSSSRARPRTCCPSTGWTTAACRSAA